MIIVELRPDHEPGVDCPHYPATCFVCQVKLDRLQRARRNCRYVRELMREREPDLSAALDLVVRHA